MAKKNIPKIGSHNKESKARYPPAKLARTARKVDNNIPKFLCLSLPLTSLGELSKAPSARASPISKNPDLTPKTIGIVIAKPRIKALEKSVLLENLLRRSKEFRSVFL